MKSIDMRSARGNQLLTPFLAAKSFGVTVFEFDELVKKHNIKFEDDPKFGKKYRMEDLKALKEAITNSTEVSKDAKIKEKPTPKINAYSKEIEKISTIVLTTLSEDNGYVPIIRDNIKIYQNTELFQKNKSSSFVLYKPKNLQLTDERIENHRCPKLYYPKEEHTNATNEILNKYKKELDDFIKLGDTSNANKVVEHIFDNAVNNPKKESFLYLYTIVKKMVESYDPTFNILKSISSEHLDITVSAHAVNIMNFAIKFCKANKYTTDDTVDIATSALLHDVGKTQLNYNSDNEVITLTDENRKIYETHSKEGADLISSCNFNNKDIELGIAEHHEKLDGSGFPKGLKKFSFYGQLIGLIHSFEAKMENLTKNGESVKPIVVLQKLKKDVDTKKFNSQIFKQFAYSLL